MPCTTILVGKKASYDGSTLIARNDDGGFDCKKMIVVNPKDQLRKYKSVIGHLEIELPDNPLAYTSCPDVGGTKGVWASGGINSKNVSMTATETITSNARVLGADPYVEYKKASSRKEKDTIGGLGEEDLVYVTLPYINSAKEGVIRLGSLLEKYGTYEPNGIAFQDKDEIWWLETIGGHAWIARRVKDEEYVVMPNQFGLDRFDFNDAYGEQNENMCSKGLKEFVIKNHLNLNNDGEFNPRLAFGSHDDSDHVYNTPRAWFMERYFNPNTFVWEGENADYTPESDDIPWSLVPEKLITVEEVKYILSSYYQGTKYNPYSNVNHKEKGMYRCIAVPNTGFMSINQIRSYVPSEIAAVEWICFGSNAFNVVVPFYTNTNKLPSFVSKVSKKDISLDNLYWSSRIIAPLVDAHYGSSIIFIERYQKKVASLGHEMLNKYDELMMKNKDFTLIDKANEEIAKLAKEETNNALGNVLLDASMHMKSKFNRSDN